MAAAPATANTATTAAAGDANASSILQQASPSSYAVTGSSSFEVQNFAIPLLFIVTMAMSQMLVSCWQSFLSVMLAKIGLNPSGGSFTGTMLVTAGIIFATILILKAAKVVSARAAKRQKEKMESEARGHAVASSTTTTGGSLFGFL